MYIAADVKIEADATEMVKVFAGIADMFEQVETVPEAVYDFWAQLGEDLGLLEEVEEE